MDVKICTICKAGFREVDAKGRCSACAKAYPDAGDLDEITANKEGLKLYVTKEDVEKIVQEKLESMLLVKKCEKCGRNYVPSSPAQKTCHICKMQEKQE